MLYEVHVWETCTCHYVSNITSMVCCVFEERSRCSQSLFAKPALAVAALSTGCRVYLEGQGDLVSW